MRNSLLLPLIVTLSLLSSLHFSHQAFAVPSWIMNEVLAPQQQETEDEFLRLINRTNILLFNNPNMFTSISPSNLIQPKLTLEELTRSQVSLNCSWPFVWVENHVVNHTQQLPPFDSIPRIIHLTMSSRCLHFYQYKVVQRWKQVMPEYSIYFHDDDAVQRFITVEEWPEFPNLQAILNCIQYKGAMTVDVWRILVVYRYGGIYCDIDTVPTWNWRSASPLLSTQSNDFVAFTDAGGRPSQWFFAMTPGHVIGYHVMKEILKRLLQMPNMAQPRVVYVTGPDAFKHGYGEALSWQEGILGDEGVFYTKGGMYRARKIGFATTVQYCSSYQDLVEEGPTNTISNSTVDEARKISIKKQIEQDTGQMHWQDQVFEPWPKKKVKNITRGPCRAHLQRLGVLLENRTLGRT
jgi:hypothetical protein